MESFQYIPEYIFSKEIPMWVDSLVLEFRKRNGIRKSNNSFVYRDELQFVHRNMPKVLDYSKGNK
ncbi:MAG TPA: hypothetical protein VI815_02385 [Candidatus Nanoarchaeia archaeon]|nr:hypothetical protein [Candidatus Nanoarchaeia archaeon]